MIRRRLAALRGALALFGCGFLLASCGGDDGENVTATSPTSSQTVTATLTDTATETAPAGPTEITIVVVNGAPQGGILREEVRKNDRVVLVVRSDVADEVHLHGYDVSRDVAPGAPARLPFEATIPGRFEVELEERGVEIADITVR